MDYQQAAALSGLRLHQNENTAGCSPRVLEAVRGLSAEQLACYPPQATATHACAAYFGVPRESLVLTNGLDQGIMSVASAWLTPTPDCPAPEAIIPVPGFDVFRIDTEAVGGHPRLVMLSEDFAFPLDAMLSAITPNTRVVFLANPNNPTGTSIPLAGIRRIAEHLPPRAIVFVDEAYADFSGISFVPELRSFGNVIVGRSFSKAFGMAGLRLGCVIGDPDRLQAIRATLPMFNVNVVAMAAVQAALTDRAYIDDFLRQVSESKALIYAACDRLGLGYWKSDANFVLVSMQAHAKSLVAAAARRGIYLRDCSLQRSCEGCVRISAGIVEHTHRCLAVAEEEIGALRSGRPTLGCGGIG